MMKNIDPMTKRPMRAHDGDKDMPNVKKSKRVQNSTSGNPAAKRVSKVKGKVATNKNTRAPRY